MSVHQQIKQQDNVEQQLPSDADPDCCVPTAATQPGDPLEGSVALRSTVWYQPGQLLAVGRSNTTVNYTN